MIVILKDHNGCYPKGITMIVILYKKITVIVILEGLQ